MNDYSAEQRVNYRICCICTRQDSNYEAWGHFYCAECNDDPMTCAVNHAQTEPEADWPAVEELGHGHRLGRGRGRRHDRRGHRLVGDPAMSTPETALREALNRAIAMTRWS